MIAHELQTCHFIVRNDRENRAKSSLQTGVATLHWVNIGLQKFIVRMQLCFEQVRNLLNDFALGETFTNAFFLSK